MNAGIVIASALAVVVFGFRGCRRPTRPIVPATDRRHPRSARPDPLSAWRQARRIRRTPRARHVASWCDELGRALRSGSTLRDALGVVVPADPSTARATAPVRLALDRGASLADATARAADPGEHLQLALAMAVTVGRIGGPGAAAIDRTAIALRQRAADTDERSVHAAQARLSSHVMTAVPLAMLAVLMVADDDMRTVATSPIGMSCIGVGLALDATGYWWMHRIVRERP